VKVTILYFAAVREIVGVDEERVDLPSDVTDVRAFAAWIQGARPELAGRMGSVRIAKNEAFAGQGAAIEEGDVLALIPPVAGG
jgi:molybdopterin converting factor subunit 1